MNEHGRHAMETMKNHDPESFAQIADPETHFSTLGREIQDRIWALSEDLIPPRGQENPLEYVGLVNMAKLRAREIVYQEMIYDGLPQEPEEMEPAPSQQDEQN
ncbi:TnpV protein [Pseudarthrobacter sp. C4D7]|uniref:TnpV protein n=2 Tax=Pseudarthrobacter TaxID=1742993 RepID=UPI0020C81009|nr:TnpV protein [Pseudarthrobacter sp. C4D7]